MGVTRGKNAGIAGTLVSVLIDGKGTALPFNAEITAHSGGLSFPKIGRRGRGSTGIPKIRLGDTDGGGTIEGKYQLVGYPLPDKPKFATGTLRYVMATDGNTPVDFVDLPVRFTGISWSLIEVKQELWSFKATWELAGNPVWTWKGQQVTVTAAAANDQETYEGLSKTFDGRGITTGAIQRIDCEGIDDTDAGEATKLAALLAAATAPPLPNLKVVSLQMTRTDSNGIAVLITWGLQDSKDQIETPQDSFLQDPNAIQDVRTLAQLFPTGSPPSTPSPPSGLKIATFTDLKTNDQQTVRTWTFKRSDTKDDVELPATETTIDPNALASKASVGKLNATPSLPSGFVSRGVTSHNIVPGASLNVIEGGLRSTADDLQMPETFTHIDPLGIDSHGQQLIVFATAGSTPGDPTPPSGLQIIGSKVQQENTVTSTKVWYFGPTSSVQRHQIQTTNSTRSASQPWTNSVGVEFASSNTDAADADTLWATAQSVAYTYALKVFSIDPLRKMVVYDYLIPGIQFQGLTGGDDRLVECQLDGSGNIQVYITRNYAMAGGYRHIFLSRKKISHKPLRHFIVSRMLKGSTIPEQGPDTIGTAAVVMPNLGDMNSDLFEGITIKTCSYKGPAFTTNIALSGTKTLFVGWQFFSDSNGLFTNVPMDLFNPAGIILSTTSTVGTAVSAGGSGPGWETIANLGLTGVITQPPSNSFAAFTAAGDVCS